MWSVEIRSPDGSLVNELPLARDIRFGKTLNDYGRASFTLDPNDPKVNIDLLHVARNEVYIKKGAVAFFGGKLVNWRMTTQGSLPRIICLAYSWEYLLTLALLEPADASVVTGYTATDIGAIISALIAEHQAKTGGNFGLTEGEIQTSANADRLDYKAYSERLELIQNLTEIQNGVDFYIAPDKVWSVYYPRKGVIRPNVELSYPGNVLGFDYEVDGIDLMTQLFVLGEGLDDAAAVGNVPSVTQIGIYGLHQAKRTYGSSVVATLEKQGAGILAQRSAPMTTIDGITFEGGTLNAPQVEDISLGDSVRLKISMGDLIEINRLFRIETIHVKITPEGAETITIGGAYA